MPSVDESRGASESNGSNAVISDVSRQRIDARPQRLNTWFNLIPVKKFEDTQPAKVPFLDSFVTIESRKATDGTNENSHSVFFEGQHEMSAVVKYGVIFVWYGDDLLTPDRPFPVIFEKPFTSKYVSSKMSEFEKTHIMDFVENGSDNLHFERVHLWDSSKMYDHVISEETITLSQDAAINYGASTTNLSGRILSKLIPQLHLHHDFVYHGPGLATVAATGIGNLNFQSMVSLTPEGAHGTRLYVTIAVDPETFPKWAEKIFGWVSPKHALCDVLARILANFVQNEFHADSVIWANKRFQNLNLLPVEKFLDDVRSWGETFYPKDFEPPVVEEKASDQMEWEYLDDVANITQGIVHPYNVAGEALVATQDAQGKIHVFDAYCPHQGAHLACPGTIDDDRIRCPFHGFHFDNEGGCLGPSETNRTKVIPGLDMTQIKYRIEDGRVEVFV